MKVPVSYKYLPLFIATWILVFATSCGNDEIPEAKRSNSNSSPIDIIIDSPVSGASYRSSDTIFINAKIPRASKVHEFLVKIRNKTVNEVEFTWTDHIHSEDSMLLDTFWINDVGHPSRMQLEISASDHEGYYAWKHLSFECQPVQ